MSGPLGEVWSPNSLLGSIGPQTSPLINTAQNYNFPMTSGLLSSMSQPSEGPDYTQTALQLAGNPHAGPYATNMGAVPPAVGGNPSAGSTSGGSTVGQAAGGLLSYLGKNPSTVSQIGHALSDWFGGAPAGAAPVALAASDLAPVGLSAVAPAADASAADAAAALASSEAPAAAAPAAAAGADTGASAASTAAAGAGTGAALGVGAIGALYGLWALDQAAGNMTPAMQYQLLANTPQEAQQQTQQLQQDIASGKAVQNPYTGQWQINGIDASTYYPLAGMNAQQVNAANAPLYQNFITDNGQDWSKPTPRGTSMTMAGNQRQ